MAAETPVPFRACQCGMVNIDALAEQFAAGVAAGRRQAADALRDIRDTQSGWLWFELGEAALSKAAGWLGRWAEGAPVEPVGEANRG